MNLQLIGCSNVDLISQWDNSNKTSGGDCSVLLKDRGFCGIDLILKSSCSVTWTSFGVVWLILLSPN